MNPLLLLQAASCPNEPASDLTWRIILDATARAARACDDDGEARANHAAELYHAGRNHSQCLAPLGNLF